MEPPYAAHRVSQQYTHTDKGIQVFTDQMPCAILLNNTKTIALAMESKFMEGSKEVYYITMAYNDDNWAVGLGIDEEGPADKQENMYLGAAPYLRQFPSGRPFCRTIAAPISSSGWGITWHASSGTRSTRCMGPAFWGSLELIQSHIVVGTMTYARKVSGQQQNRIMISQNVLNHRIDVPQE